MGGLLSPLPLDGVEPLLICGQALPAMLRAEVDSPDGFAPIIAALAQELARCASTTPVVCLDGEPGAGKTTFMGQMLAALGVEDLVTSPTFSLVNSYHDASGRRHCHFDLYRIRDPGELEFIGFDDDLQSGAVCWIEWWQNADCRFSGADFALHLNPAPEGPRMCTLYAAA